MKDKMHRPTMGSMKQNPNGENTMAPKPMGKGGMHNQNHGKKSGGTTVNPLQIPTTIAYTGKRMKTGGRGR